MKFEDCTEIELLALCIWAEARGEPLEGQLAVGGVVMERFHAKKWYGDSVRHVIMKPRQFSCFNTGETNRKKMEAMTEIPERFCCISEIIYNGYVVDLTRGATHYHHKRIEPYWVPGVDYLTTIGNLKFYIET